MKLVKKMRLFKPSMYQKSIFTIPYQVLKKGDIKCLIFDLDNTLALIDEKKCPSEVCHLIKELKEQFLVVILSNNNKKRIEPYCRSLEVDGVAWAMKPFTRGLKKIQKKYNLKKENMVIIGDQLMTDIKAGTRFGIQTILVDPLGKKDLKITKFNRILEQKMLHRLKEEGLFQKGEYYEGR